MDFIVDVILFVLIMIAVVFVIYFMVKAERWRLLFITRPLTAEELKNAGRSQYCKHCGEEIRIFNQCSTTEYDPNTGDLASQRFRIGCVGTFSLLGNMCIGNISNLDVPVNKD